MTTNLNDIIKIPIDPHIDIESQAYARKKIGDTIDRDDLEARTLETKIQQIKRGIIATLSFAEWISPYVNKCIVYDRIRTDQFRNPDPGWDVKLTVKSNEYEVDAKSSGPASNTLDLNTVLSSRNLATKPSVIQNGAIVKRGEERDINIQAYFLPEDSISSVYLISWASLSDLLDIGPPARHIRKITSYGRYNPREHYDSLLGTLRPMQQLVQFLAHQ